MQIGKKPEKKLASFSIRAHINRLPPLPKSTKNAIKPKMLFGIN